MPHSRHRFSTAQVLEKLRFYPVVALQGARQTGKSYLSRELLQQHLPESRYLTFDQDSARVLAERDIESFLLRNADARPLILDEAQKVPRVFDAIKFVVDQKRVPGALLLLGSTEFSRIMGILESLTGRMGRVRIHPLTLAECHSLPVAAQLATRKPHPFFLEKAPRLPKAAVLKHLETGGLPGIFSVRSADERRALFQDWFDLTTQRDAHTIPKLKLDSGLLARILQQLARLDEPTAPEVARALRVDLRRIKRHLEALETLFVVSRVDPHALSSGQPHYFLFDCGLAAFLGADLQRQLETLFLQEYQAKRAWLKHPDPVDTLSIYRTHQGRRVGFIRELSGGELALVRLFDHPPSKKTDFFALEGAQKAIQTKVGKKTKVRLIALSPTLHAPNPKSVELLPWEAMA